jgi:FAD/FMN-containing dehydrogenase
MNKVAHYLQEHLVGEVITSSDARKYFSTDTSIFSVVPSIIVYPRNENDLRKSARFTWQLAERGRSISMTARGAGTDQGGAALGSGIVLVFPAYLNRVLELDGKTGNVTVEPGINYGKLQQTLHTHNRFLPPFPASMEYSTIGGAVGNNAGGEKSVKYGSTRDFVAGLRVVLANGEVIETRRVNRRELNKKLGLATLEGEIYRSLDTLIEENWDTIKLLSTQPVTKNAAGYALDQVKRKDGSLDLTPLFVGSQGTLGIISEITLRTEPHNPNTTLVVAYCDDLTVAQEAIKELRNLPEMPSAIEMVDGQLLDFVSAQNPNQLKGVIDAPYPKVTLLVEFDAISDRMQKRLSRKAVKIFEKYQLPSRVESDQHIKEELWKIRTSASAITGHASGTSRALPLIDDGVVPIERLSDYMKGLYDLFKRHNLKAAVWGHAGDGNLHVQPLLDLASVGDRQKAFKIMEEYYNMVIDMGGTTTGQYNDGRLRAPYLPKLYGQEIYSLFQKVKKIFDPYNTLNPGVKIDVTLENIKPLLRQEYSMKHLHDHLPRS